VPLTLNGHQIPIRSAGFAARERNGTVRECVHIGLINNMPDPALEETEDQFLGLLDAAAGDLEVHVRLYSLPEIVRGERAQQHMCGLYADLSDFQHDQLDALIITGMEPCNVDLRKETYWQRLTHLLDWAERETTSTVLSCLATHSGVLHSDSIERHRLSDKRFGVFEEKKVCDHLITVGIAEAVRVPHSRWNEVREEDLASCGYVTLTKSQEGGVGLFAKQKRESLFLYFQGHPEYATHTLLKEYRRDIRRFVRGERETYPSLPKDYFDAQATELLTKFRRQVLANPREDLLVSFPYDLVANTLHNGWHELGIRVYRNWLEYLRSHGKKGHRMPNSYEPANRGRSTMR
jgi:homoserine O-succinyltransferase